MARSAVPSKWRGLQIPLGYLHLGKCERSGVQSHPPLCIGRWMVFDVMRMRECQARDWLRKSFVLLISRQKFNGHFENIFFNFTVNKIW